MIELNPLAFTQHERGRAARRWVHLALDVNEGETLCGQRIAYVEQAGVVTISVPRAAVPFNELCIACEGRRIALGMQTRRT